MANNNKINFRNEMRDLVILISRSAKKINPDFFVVPQNAMELVTLDGKPDGELAGIYLSSIDGAGCEELFYGHSNDGIRTAKDITDYFLGYLEIIKRHGKAILVIDYVTDKRQAHNSFMLCKKYGFISFQTNRSLTKIPNWIFDNSDDEVLNIKDAKNLFYLLNAALFRSPDIYIKSLQKVQHDLLVIDAFFWGKILTQKQVLSLKRKESGKKRLVLAYLSIGEAEDYRYYWKGEWKRKPPVFLEKENREWKGNYKVRYWMDGWKEIICGRTDGTGFENSYLKKIIDLGFDGVYLDVVDAAYYFEEKQRK